ncbi:MAG: hypothetical protein H0Z37_02470 [Firmicutes bacterium]|nr:hypothetical protein [Bacillota bacterium]
MKKIAPEALAAGVGEVRTVGVQFPDLQVLLPRMAELARIPPAAQQAEAHQQSLAMAGQVQADRNRRRVSRAGRGAAGEPARRDPERPAASRKGSTLGGRVDVRV